MIVGFTCGAFDLMHPGHLILFEYASERCDKLIVGLHTDPSIERPTTKRRPIQTTLERYLQLKSCRWIDEIIPYDTERDLTNFLKLGVINRRFIGNDYIDKRFTGDELPIEVCYVPRAHDYSSTFFVNKIVDVMHQDK